jgi:hypothetical protein
MATSKYWQDLLSDFCGLDLPGKISRFLIRRKQKPVEEEMGMATISKIVERMREKYLKEGVIKEPKELKHVRRKRRKTRRR